MDERVIDYDALTDGQRARVNQLWMDAICAQVEHVKAQFLWPTYMHPTEEMVKQAVETLKIQKGWHKVLVLYASSDSVCVYIWSRESNKRAYNCYVMICPRNREKREAKLRAAMENLDA